MNGIKTTNASDLHFGKYFLGQTIEEIQRLDIQYHLLKAGFGYTDTFDLPLDISSASELHILDIATGTGAWILDVVNCIPGIASRLSTTAPNRVTLSACDISDAKFPAELRTGSLGINFFLQDVTQPFPREMHGQFDLIHVSLLCFALTEEGWHSALRNIHDLLKPGGILLSMEYNVGLQIPGQSVAENDIYDINAYIHSESSVVNRCNSLFVYSAERNGFVWGLCSRLPEMLKLAQLEITSVRYLDLPYGAARGDRLSKDYALDNIWPIFDTVSKELLSKNDLEIPRGHKITTEEGRKQALKELYRDMVEEGCFSGLAEWIIRKTLES